MGNNQEGQNKSQAIAKEKFDWAMERTRLAKERTFATWLRTSLATTVAGLGIVKLLPDMRPLWMGKAIGLLFVFSSLITLVMGFKTYYTVLKKLENQGFQGLDAKTMGIISLIFFLITLLAFIMIVIH